MNERSVAQVPGAHRGQPGSSDATQQACMTDEEHGRLAPLYQLAERLQQTLQPVQPSAAFVRNLGKDLVDNAKRQIALKKRLRRITLIGVAALGSLLSIASVVGAIVFLVARLRAREHARALQSPTGRPESVPA